MDAPSLLPNLEDTLAQNDRPANATSQTPTGQQDPSQLRMVNSKVFELDYDLQSVGPWGVSKVELWGTHDGGETWQSFGVDPDSRSPMRVTVPGEGQYGFLILVDGANGAGAIPPRPGTSPELLIRVDLRPPQARLEVAQLGRANLSDQLQVRWSADDLHLHDRPIGLFYSSFPGGPWSTIATGLENTGGYSWRIERHVPDRFFLRLEARDLAGNVASYVTPEPISLSRPKPTGHLRSVRPLEHDAR